MSFCCRMAVPASVTSTPHAPHSLIVLWVNTVVAPPRMETPSPVTPVMTLLATTPLAWLHAITPHPLPDRMSFCSTCVSAPDSSVTAFSPLDENVFFHTLPPALSRACTPCSLFSLTVFSSNTGSPPDMITTPLIALLLMSLKRIVPLPLELTRIPSPLPLTMLLFSTTGAPPVMMCSPTSHPLRLLYVTSPSPASDTRKPHVPDVISL
mmetsp:Transcript_64014/g.151443  ORF Transcript_64014/g.151443 Transcript_64014/m.151443 type:complete len:209 (-) Transcript_64014:588-1214(-)